jgi:ligand-binding sensor domain-containing protein
MAFGIVTMHLLSQAQGDQITFEHFGQDDGLSAPVTRIAQDSLGFLWLGTTDGLNRFDGKKFVVYRNNAEDPHSLPNNIINDLRVDSLGRMWIATNGGLCYYHFAEACACWITI